jgi:hypothetical protein
MIRYDIVDLSDYLRLNSNAIVDLVQRKYVPAENTKEPTFDGVAAILQAENTKEPTFDGVAAILQAEKTKEPTFEELAALLMGRFVHQHGSEKGRRDKAHNVLALAIICSMWCGWLSQAKANRGKYSPEWVDGFKKIIVDAFEIGQKYAKDRP